MWAIGTACCEVRRAASKAGTVRRAYRALDNYAAPRRLLRDKHKTKQPYGYFGFVHLTAFGPDVPWTKV